MTGSKIATERLVGLFLLAVLLLNPPFLLIFDTTAVIAGIPVLYLYLFVAWGALIALLAFVTELSGAAQNGDTDTDTDTAATLQPPDDSPPDPGGAS